MAGKDYYQILGIRRDAGEKEVKQAYRKLARKYHPDVNPGDKSAESRFKEINEAYEVLSDKEKRKKYDRYGDKWQYADQFEQAGYQTPPGGFGQGDFGRTGGAFHFEESDLGSIFDELFKGGYNRTYRSQPRPRRGQDIEHSVEVTLEEAYHGSTRILGIEATEPCSSCNGTGLIQGVPCSNCRGAGMVSRLKRIEVKIPRGVKDNSRVRVAGKGGQGNGGAASGDLYLVISVKPHSQFHRKDDNLYVDVGLPLTIAMLGGQVEVPTLKGKLELKVPPETQNGRTFRLAGQGMPQLGKSSYGDLFARASVVLPTNLSDKEKELFKQLRDLRQNR